jgi:hypothetical protein
MNTTMVTAENGDVVKVTNIPTVTTYYRGRYYRTMRTAATTPSGFRMITTSTFIYNLASRLDIRWFWSDESRMISTRVYDDTHVTESAPF